MRFEQRRPGRACRHVMQVRTRKKMQSARCSALIDEPREASSLVYELFHLKFTEGKQTVQAWPPRFDGNNNQLSHQ